MPRFRRFKRSKKGFRKTYRRRRRRLGVSRLSLRSTKVFPDKIFVKLPYATLLSRAPGAITDEYSFRGNSCYDPDYTGVGSQPVGFDQYSELYNEYRVMSSRISIEIVNNIASGMNVTLMASTGAAGSGSFIGSSQQPYTKYKFAGGTSSSNKIYIKNFMKSSKMWGRPVKTEDNFAALINANPVNEWFWVFEAVSSNASTNLSYDMLVRIIYYVEFSSRKTLPTS